MKRIFVSSTFRDMNFERDTLMRLVIPELEETAREYGDSISFCDLRWGVDTTDLESEEGSRKVLSVCLDEIDSCRPYMIVLLGQRYGWIPSQELVEETIRSRDLELEELQKSVTALEIEYGALQNSRQLERTLFYFREMDGEVPEDYRSEGARHTQKLDALKARIMNATGGRVQFYHARWNPDTSALEGMEDFARMVTADVRQMLQQEWQEFAELSPFRQDQRSQWEYAEEKARQFRARESLAREYLDELSARYPLLALKGHSGTGKSTLISYMATQLRDRNCDVLPIFCGSSSFCTGAMDVLMYMVNYLEDLLSQPHIQDSVDNGRLSLQQWQDRLTFLIRTHEKQSSRELYFLIDAVDQLTADMDRANLIFLPGDMGKRTKLVMSCLPTLDLPNRLTVRHVPTLLLNERKEILEGIQTISGRKVSQVVQEAILEKASSGYPLYLSLLLARLEMMDQEDFQRINRRGGDMDAINDYQLWIIRNSSEDLNELCVQVLDDASRKLRGNIAFTAIYMAASRYGLREKDLESLFNLEMHRLGTGQTWNSLAFSRFRKYMRRFFLLRADGRLDFAHQAFRKGFLTRFPDQTSLHHLILEYFQTLDIHDPVRMREFVWHCVRCDNRQLLVDYITRFHDDEEIMYFAARDIAAIAMQDEGAWLISLLQEAEKWNAGPEFSEFIRYTLEQAFPPTHSCLELQSEIADAWYEWLFRRLDADSTPENGRRLAFCCSLYAQICQTLQSKEDLDLALTLVEMSRDLHQYNFDDSQTLLDLLYLAESYDQLGRLYLSIEESLGLTLLPFSSLEYREKAAEAFETSKEMWETIVRQERCNESLDSLAGCLELLGGVYLRMPRTKGDTREDEESLCRQALALRIQIAEEDDSPENQRKLASAYLLLSKFCRKTEEYQEAADAINQCIKLRRVLAEESEDDALRKELSDAYKEAGDFLSLSRDKQPQKLSLYYYQQSLQIDSILADKLETNGAYDDWLGSAMRIARHRRTPIHLRVYMLYNHWRLRRFLHVRTGNQRYQAFLPRQYAEMEKTTPGYSWLIILIACVLAFFLLKGQEWFDETFHTYEWIEKAAQWTANILVGVLRWLFGLFGLRI